MSQLYRLQRRRPDFDSEESEGSEGVGCDQAQRTERGDGVEAMQQLAPRGDVSGVVMDIEHTEVERRIWMRSNEGAVGGGSSNDVHGSDDDLEVFVQERPTGRGQGRPRAARRLPCMTAAGAIQTRAYWGGSLGRKRHNLAGATLSLARL